MPYWKPSRSPYMDYFTPLHALPGVKVETASPSSYALSLVGVRSETEAAIRINRGEDESVTKGTYIRTIERITTDTKEYEVEVVKLAIEDNALLTVIDKDSGNHLSPEERLAKEEAEQAFIEDTFQRNIENNQTAYYDGPVYETAPDYNPSNSDDPIYQPENAPPPVQYEETPEEIQPVDEPTVHEPTYYELRDLEETGGYAGDGAGYTSEEEPFVVSHGGESYIG